MELPLKELTNLLKSSQRILLTGPQDPSIDVICSAAAWQIFLWSQNKQADIVLAGSLTPLKFLPGRVQISSGISDLNKFKISVDISKTKVKQLSYDVLDDFLVIDILPLGGNFRESDIKFSQGDYKYDLVIVLGAINHDALGQINSGHRHFFQNVPVINIDRQVLNENYGQLNIVESTATSLSEISYYALQTGIDKEMATCLLAGLMAATNSFQSAQVTPQVLELASQLIVKGADQPQIVETLYRTKDLKTLKNWGRILSRLQKKENILSSYLQHDEVEKLPLDFSELVRDLILSTPQAQVAMIFYQMDFDTTEVWLYAISNINALDLTRGLGGLGQRHFAKFAVHKPLDESRQLVIERIQEKLKIINSF
ncbi:MAG: hypothetical protein WC465_02505 [Patescibacteria group bacterium]